MKNYFIFKKYNFKTLTETIIKKDNILIIIFLLAFYPFLIQLVIAFLLVICSYLLFETTIGPNDYYNSFVAAKNNLVPLVLNAVFVSPLWETAIFFMLIMELSRKTSISKVWVVHGIAVAFALAHLFRGFFILPHYVSGVIWAWAWVLWEEKPEKKINTFFLIFWAHALKNGFTLLIYSLY